MKNLYKYVIMGILALGLGSCDDDEENITVVVQDTVETGAVLRTIQVISNELPIGIDAGFAVQIEEQDEFEGDLLASVDVFATFADNSPDDGDTTGANFNEFAVRTIDATEFTDPSPFGLPRHTLEISSAELNAGAGVTGDQLFGGDTFTIRLSLNLTDGRVFSVSNAGGVITGGFFNSPFQYIATVTCPVEAEFAVGTYQLSIIEGVFPAFGATVDWIEEPVSIVGGTGDTERIIENACYLPEFGMFCGPLTFNLVCGSVILPNQAPGGGVGCGSAIILESDLDDLGAYDPADDTTIQLIFQNNVDDLGGCGADEYRAVLELTRI